ncbi:hypothetical protein TWF281_004062 [Arthrobotrys megalospora]
MAKKKNVANTVAKPKKKGKEKKPEVEGPVAPIAPPSPPQLPSRPPSPPPQQPQPTIQPTIPELMHKLEGFKTKIQAVTADFHNSSTREQMSSSIDELGQVVLGIASMRNEIPEADGKCTDEDLLTLRMAMIDSVVDARKLMVTVLATIQEDTGMVEEQHAAIDEEKASAVKKEIALHKIGQLGDAVKQKKAAIQELTDAIKRKKEAIAKEQAAIDQERAAIKEERAAVEAGKATCEKERADAQQRMAAIRARIAAIQEEKIAIHKEMEVREGEPPELEGTGNTQGPGGPTIGQLRITEFLTLPGPIHFLYACHFALLPTFLTWSDGKPLWLRMCIWMLWALPNFLWGFSSLSIKIFTVAVIYILLWFYHF